MKFLISPLPIYKFVEKTRSIIMSECENVQYVTEFNNTLKQLAKTFGREEKRVIVKYQGDYKYVHIYHNRKEAKYPDRSLLQEAGKITSLMLNCLVQLYDKFISII